MESVIKIVSEYLEVDNVKPESHLVDDLGADVFDTIEIIIKVEDKLGVKIPDEEGKILYHFIVADYRAHWKSGECSPGDDAQDVQWFNLNKLGSIPLLDKTRIIILKAVGKPDST